MGVAARRRQAGVSDRSLHQVRWGAAVEGVADVGVPEPVRRHGRGQAGALGRNLDDAVHLRTRVLPPLPKMVTWPASSRGAKSRTRSPHASLMRSPPR